MTGGRIKLGIDLLLNKNGINELKKELANIQTLASNTDLTGNAKKQLKEAAKAAKQLSVILDKTWNSKLNQPDLSKLNKSIQKTYGNLDNLKNIMVKSGVQGTQAYSNFEKKISGTNIELRQSSKILDKMAITMANTVRYGISSSIFNNFTNSIEKAWDFTKKLDTSLNDIRIVTDKSADSMASFAKQANKAAKELGASTRDYTEASLIYYQQGLSDEEVQARTETTLKAANVTGQRSEEVSEQLTAVWNGYKVSAEEAELYVDKLAAVAATTAADLEELSTGMSKVASAANLMGVDIDQLNAQLATIVSVTRQAPESVGTALKTIYARMGDIKSGLDDETTLDEYTKKMAEMGVNVLDANNHLRDMGEVIEEIGSKWTSLSREQQIALSQIMAGTRQYNNLLSLFDNWSMYEEALKTSGEAAGTLQKQQEIYMESTEAHLQELRTEAERTYGILFDSDTANGFAETLINALDGINDILEGLGGGTNALLNIGSQLTYVFNKQLGDSLIRQIDNIKRWREENGRLKESLEQIQSRVIIGHQKEGFDIKESFAKEEAQVIQKALQVRKGLSSKEYNTIANKAREIAQNRQELQSQEELRAFAEMELDITNVIQAQDNYNKTLDETEESLRRIGSVFKSIRELETAPDEEQAGLTGKEIEDIFSDSVANEKELVRLKNLSDDLTTSSSITERDLTFLKKLRNKKEEQYNTQLVLSKNILTATEEVEKGITKQKELQTNEMQEQIDEILKNAGRKETATKFVQYGALLVEGFTAASGALGVFLDENAKGAQKANAAWQGVVGTGSALLNAFYPGSGFIFQGIASLAKPIVENTKLWKYFEDSLKDSNELLKEAKERTEEVNKAQSEGIKQYKESIKTGKELKEIEDRFKYLQSLSEKGLLTDDLQSEYEGYLEKVQRYNKEAEISYDRQGNLITSNNNLMSDTLKKMEEINKIQLEETFSEEKWKEQSKAYDIEVKGKKKGFKEAQKQWGKRLSKTREGYREAPKNILEEINLSGDELYEQLGNLEDIIDQNFPTLKDKLENIQQIETRGTVAIQESVSQNQEIYIEYLDKYIEELRKIKGEYQSTLDATVNAIEIDTGRLLNAIKYGSQKGQYETLAESLGGDNFATKILAGYINSVKNQDKYLKEGGLDTLKKDVLSYQSTLNQLLQDPELGSIFESTYKGIANLDEENLIAEEYEKAIHDKIAQFLGKLEEDQYNQIKPYLANLFGLKDISTEWTTQGAKFVEGLNQVTLGEDIARKIGKDFSDLAGLEGADKKNFSEGLEKMLQSSLTETDLKNLDTASFINNFITYLNQELVNAEKSKSKLDLTSVFNRTLKSLGLKDDRTDQISRTSIQKAKELGYTEEALSGYSKKLQEINPELAKNQKLTEKVSISQMDLAKDLKVMIDQWGKWEKNLEEVDKDTVDYYQTLGEMAEALGDVFNIDISTDFIEKNLDKIKAAIHGDISAFEELQTLAAKDYVANLDINANPERIDEIRGILNQFIDEYNGKELGFTAKLDDSNFIKSLNGMLKNGELTEKQVNEYLAGIGYEGEVGYKEGPETETSSEVAVELFGKQFKVGTVKTKTKSQVPYLKSVTKTSSASSRAQIYRSGTSGSNAPKTSGRGGGGGSAPKQPEKIDAVEDESDRYHDVNLELKQIDTNLQRLDRQKEKLFGAELIENLNKQLKLLDNQIETTQKKLKIAGEEQLELQQKLAKKGVLFDSEGFISNYAEVYKSQLDYLNNIINKYNNMSAKEQEKYKEEVEKAKEAFENFKDNINRYDDLISSDIPQMQDDIQEAINEQLEIQIDQFNMEIELRLKMGEAEKDWNDFKKQIINGIEDTDILGNVKADLDNFFVYYKEQDRGIIQANAQHIRDTLAQLKQMDTTGTSNVYGDNRKQALDDLQNYYQQLMSDLRELEDLQDKIHGSYLEMMDEAQEKFDEQINSFGLVSDILEHDMNLISLLKGEDAFKDLATYFDKQGDNYNKQLDFQRKQVDFWRAQMEAAEEGSKEWDSAREKWTAAVQDLNATIEESIQNLQDKYLNALNSIFQDLNNKVTKGMGLDYVETQWELINKNADQYLDTINAAYGIQQLENKYLDAIDQTDSVSAQRQLNKLKEEQIKALREQDKLTQYDVDRANLKYEIALKQIALQEAQQNKTSMRLRRDSQGNYSYQFVADQDAIGQLQDELDALNNDLYNFDLNRYKENLGQLYDVWVEYQERMKEAAQINDPKLRAETELLLQEEYGELINGIVAQNATVRNNLQESAFEDLAILYDKDLKEFQNMTDAERDLIMNELVPQWNSGIQEMADTFANKGGFTEICKDAMNQIRDLTTGYENDLKELQESAKVNFDEISKGIDQTIQNTQDLIKNNSDLINGYKDELDAVKAVIDELDNLIIKYQDARKEALSATEAAYKYWQEQNRQAAESAKKDQASKGNTPANTGTSNTNQGNKGSGSQDTKFGSGDGVLNVGDTATFNGSYYYDSFGTAPAGSRYSGVAKGVIVDIVNNNPYGAHIHSADGKYMDLGWVKKQQLKGYDTGGYTGNWNNKEGKLALLHKKELVLNENDTTNILNAVEILRNINSIILDKIGKMTMSSIQKVGGKESDALEQNVHIDASFPGVQDSKEIEQAFDNLINIASQKIGRKKDM